MEGKRITELEYETGDYIGIEYWEGELKPYCTYRIVNRKKSIVEWFSTEAEAWEALSKI